MTKYIVYVKSYYEVEAVSEEDAEDKALDMLQRDINNGNVYTQIHEDTML